MFTDHCALKDLVHNRWQDLLVVVRSNILKYLWECGPLWFEQNTKTHVDHLQIWNQQQMSQR